MGSEHPKRLRRKLKVCFECTERRVVKASLDPFCSRKCAAQWALRHVRDTELEIGVAWCIWHGWWFPGTVGIACTECNAMLCEACGHPRNVHDPDPQETCHGTFTIDCECLEFVGQPRGDEE